MLFSGFELDSTKISQIRQRAADLANQLSIHFETSRHPHVTLHYFGKNLSSFQKDEIILPAYQEMMQQFQLQRFSVSILPVPHLFGLYNDILVLEMQIPPTFRSFAEKIREHVPSLDSSIPAPDFKYFNPHLSIGSLKETDPVRKEAFLTQFAQIVSDIAETHEVDRIVFFSTPDPVTGKYSRYFELPF